MEFHHISTPLSQVKNVHVLGSSKHLHPHISLKVPLKLAYSISKVILLKLILESKEVVQYYLFWLDKPQKLLLRNLPLI